MSSEQILMCQNCQLTFESNEELTIHSCVKIKEENQDSKDKIDSTNGDNSDRKQVGIFEPALDLVKVKLEEAEEAEENEPIKLKKKRKRPKKAALLDLPDLVDSYQGAKYLGFFSSRSLNMREKCMYLLALLI